MPPHLHAEVARAAERGGTSLNGFIISSLAASVGWTEGEPGRDVAAPTRNDGRFVTWLLVANVVAVALAGLAAVVILLVAA
jgi:hypothetical protein